MHTRHGNVVRAIDVGDADLIMHHANCLAVRSHGLAARIFARYPRDDVYAQRDRRRNCAAWYDRSMPGTSHVGYNVVSLFGQWRPGRMHANLRGAYPDYVIGEESAAMRLCWFKEALNNAADKIRVRYGDDADVRIAVPHGIGCSAAGGNWHDYRNALCDWARANPRFIVTLYVLNS